DSGEIRTMRFGRWEICRHDRSAFQPTERRWPRECLPVSSVRLDGGHQRPDTGEIHLLDRNRLQVGLREERGQVEVRLESDVNRERRNHPLDAGQNEVRAEEKGE